MIPFRNVIVCHIQPGSESIVGGVFGHYDAITRPQDLGVIGRSILSHHDLYIHILDRKQDPAISGQRRGLPAFQQIAEAMHDSHDEIPAFHGIMADLADLVGPYRSDRWTGPRDSVASVFYRWDAPDWGHGPVADLLRHRPAPGHLVGEVSPSRMKQVSERS